MPRLRALSSLLFSLNLSLLGQTGAGPTDFTFSVSGAHVWTDTGLDLQRGDLLQISASNEQASATGDETRCDAKGTSATAAAGAVLPLPSAPARALIARLHEQTSAILIGTGSELRIDEPSHLYLGVNIADTPGCSGTLSVKVHKTAGVASNTTAVQSSAAAPTQAQALTTQSSSASSQSSGAEPSSGATAEAPAKSRGEQLKSQLSTAAQIFMAGQFGVGKSDSNHPEAANAASGAAATSSSAPAPKVSDSPIDAELSKSIEALPRRVNDRFHNLGDMVNFVIVGSEKDVQAALEAGNWHPADTNNQKAVLSAVLETYEKKDYLQMPMSTLYLFGRPQDFGYEQAEPIAMVASRHHFRIWKAPFKWKDHEVWVGAGTHDVGFAKDQRNGSVTHKIDPAVDGERDNIGASLQHGGKIKSLSYYSPANPVQEAKNATGDSYHSDGKLLVIFLQ